MPRAITVLILLASATVVSAQGLERQAGTPQKSNSWGWGKLSFNSF